MHIVYSRKNFGEKAPWEINVFSLSFLLSFPVGLNLPKKYIVLMS